MVLQNIVDHYLNKILKDYIEDYSSDQFNLKFGIAELNNLRIKLSAINVLDLPVKLKHGFIGNLTLKVNFKNIYSTQLSLSIKDVYLVFVPSSSSKYNEALELEKQRAYKNAQLKKIEQTLLLMSSDGTPSVLENKDDSFVTKILLQIFNNVQVRIENVHIRLEDDLSNVKTPFAFGLTFSNLVFVTPDPKDKQKFKLNNASSGIFKIAVLSHFGLYFNCYLKELYRNDFLSTHDEYKSINKAMKKQIAISNTDKPPNTDYVLEPINFHCKVFIHRKPYEDNFEIPAADIEMNLDKFALDLNRIQFETLLVVVDNINRLSIAVAYRKWRPETNVHGNARVWWKFAIICTLETNVRRKQRNWNWAHIRDHLQKRKKYKELYKKKLLSDKTRENLENLIQKYEDEFDVLNLTIVRNQAKLECKDQLEAMQRERSRKKEEEKNTGWFGGWWSSGTKSTTDSIDGETDEKKGEMNLIEEVRKEFNNESEKQKLYAAINYDETQKDETFPLGYAAQQVSFVIKSINLNITDKNESTKISEFFLSEVKLNLSVLPTSNGLNLMMSINSMKMFGLRNKKVPIIEPIPGKNTSNMIEFEFVLNPIQTQVKYDFGIIIKAQGLKMVYDKETIERLVEMMSVTREVNLDEIQTIAALKLNEFQQRSMLGLEYAIENHKKLNLSLSLEPSFILVPETGSIETANHILLVSLGHFDITSKLVDYNKKELKEMIVNKTPKEKLEMVRNSAYENYSLSICKVQLILSDKANWIEDIDSAHYHSNEISSQSSKRHLIYPISLDVTLSRCIIMDDPDLALMKVNAKIPDIQLIVEHRQIINLLKLLLSVVKKEDFTEMSIEEGKSKSLNQINTNRLVEGIQSDVIKAVANEKQAKHQQIFNQVKIQAEFTINKLLIELKNEENTIVRGLMNDLFTEFKMTDENMIIGLNLDSIQFFCCMNYYQYINVIQSEVMKQLNESPNVVKELQSAYTASLSGQEKDDKKKSKKEIQTAKKQPQQATEQNKIVTLNMGRVDFIMLEDFKLKDNAAVIFNMQLQVMFRQHANDMNVNLSLINTQMAITGLSSYLMNSYVELFILKPCDLTCNVVMKEDDNQQISVLMQELSLSISPNMVQILMTMLSKLAGSAVEEEKAQKQADRITTSTDFKKVHSLDQSLWYIKLMNEEKKICQDSDIEMALEATEEVDLCLSPSSEISEEDRIIKQEVVLEIKTINFIIESGGSSSIPLIRFNTNLFGKFQNYDDLHIQMQMYMEYYNENNFYWEPIFDIIDKRQWEFKARVKYVQKQRNKNQKQMVVSFESAHRLEITISNVALGIFKSLFLSFSKAVNQPEILSKEEQNIVIENSTEMTLFFYVDITKLTCQVSSQESNLQNKLVQKNVDSKFNLVTLNPFSEMTLYPLTKDSIDSATVLNYSFIVNEREYNRSLPLLMNDKCINVIYSNIYPGINCKYVVDCSSRDQQTRYINFYSNVIVHNHLKIPMSIYRFDQVKEVPEKVGDIEPGEKLYLPIKLVYSNEDQYVYIRPSENYLLPVNALIWRFDEFDKVKLRKKSYKTVLCEPIDKEHDKNIYVYLAHHLERIRIENCDEINEDSFDSLHHFELFPQFMIRNLLPLELEYRTSQQEKGFLLKSGQDNQIIDIKDKGSEIRFDIVNYNDMSWSCTKTNFRWPREDCTEVWEFRSSASLFSQDTLLLAVNFTQTDENGFRLLTIFAPFWMVNNTGLRLKYNLGDNLCITHEPKEDQVNLVCFKSKQLTEKKRMQLSLDNSHWSEHFPVDVVGSKGSIMVEMPNKTFCFFTINISLSEVLFTKIVKFDAFYTVISRIDFDVEISENGLEWTRLNYRTSRGLFPRDDKKATIYLRLPGKSTSSKGVSLKCTALTVLDVNDIMVCCHVEVTNHAVVVEIVNYYDGCSPVLLVNCLEDKPLIYGQLGEEERFRLPPKSMVQFNWIEPQGFRCLIWQTPESNEIENYLDKDLIGESGVGQVYWITFYDDCQRILLISKNKKLISKIFGTNELIESDMKLNACMNGVGISMVNLSIMKEICYFSISSSDVVWENRKNGSKVYRSFVGKEIDLIEAAYQKYLLATQTNDEAIERIDKITSNLHVDFSNSRMLKPYQGLIKRTCLTGFWLSLSKSEKMINVHLKMNKIQIDNQLDDHIFATIFCPVPPPKSIQKDFSPKPFIEFSTVIQFNNNRRRFKYFSFLIQEFAVQVDLDFANAIQDYLSMVAKRKSTDYEEQMKNSIEFALKKEIIPEEKGSSSKHSYDAINLSPLKMHLSFSLGTIDTLNLPSILDYLVKSAGVTLIEFKDAVLRIEGFNRENTIYTDEEFTNELMEHYKAAALRQFYMIIFGLDVLGNPVGLLLGVTKGATDLFYEPAMGLIQGPEEFAEGLVLGVRSLFSSTVGGVAGAFGKITGTLGEGISSLMDQAERKKRRERLNKHSGIVQNSKNLAKGFFSGVTGLVSKPMEGAKREGFGGLMKGVGHGMIGLVAQPTTGIIDFTSGTLNQLQRTVNVAEEVKRIRPARAIQVDGVLTSYNSHEAMGREMLRNLINKSSFLQNDIYVCHCLISKDRLFMITNRHILCIKNNGCLFKSHDVNWYVDNTNIRQIERNDKTLLIHVKKPKKALGLFGEKFVFELNCESIDIASWIHNRLQSLIKLELEFFIQFNFQKICEHPIFQ